MKRKDLRLVVGIILHPFRSIIYRMERRTNERVIRFRVKENWWHKNHERMHNMSWLCNEAYTKSDLYFNLHHGALD